MDLLCNCTSPGCDFALVDAYGDDFKGLCRSDGLCMAVVEKDGGVLLRNYLYAVDIALIDRFDVRI